jgi:hypothetical protein
MEPASPPSDHYVDTRQKRDRYIADLRKEMVPLFDGRLSSDTVAEFAQETRSPIENKLCFDGADKEPEELGANTPPPLCLSPLDSETQPLSADPRPRTRKHLLNKPLKADADRGVRFLCEPESLVCERGKCGLLCTDALFMWDDKTYCSESCRTLTKSALAAKKATANPHRGKVGMGLGRRRSEHCLSEMASVCEDTAR